MKREGTEKCPYCNEVFYCIYIEQFPECADEESKVCPYCNKTIETSLEYDFFTRRL